MFKRTMFGKVVLNLTDDERVIIAGLYNQMLELLDTPEVPESTDPLAALVGLDGPTEISHDPAIARLFPDAYLDDEDAASDFRRFTEPDLRNEKLNNLNIVGDILEAPAEKIELNQDQVNAWLRSLNDVRLVLGTRLGIGELDEEEPFERNPDDPSFHLYDYLTYLQGTLIDAL